MNSARPSKRCSDLGDAAVGQFPRHAARSARHRYRPAQVPFAKHGDRAVSKPAEGQVGEIHFRQGEIWHATAGEFIGVPALEEMMRWPGGQIQRDRDAGKLPAHDRRAVGGRCSCKRCEEPTEKRRRCNRAASAVPSSPPPEHKRRKTVLVIDDTEMLLIFAAEVLAPRTRLCNVATASTGREGLQTRGGAAAGSDSARLQPDGYDRRRRLPRAAREGSDGAHSGADDVGASARARAHRRPLTATWSRLCRSRFFPRR